MLAIQNNKGGFHPRWVKYCEEKGIPYKYVNCYENDIIAQLDGCSALMWHHSQSDPKDILVANRILFSLEHSGKKVFPNFKTNWHFDDKIGQKYLLEALNVPLINSYVFIDKIRALSWLDETVFPKVFKLSNGAGSANVKLVRDKKEAEKLIKKAFKNGFKSFNSYEYFIETLRKFKLGKSSKLDILKSIGRIIIPPEFSKIKSNERHYVYFQDYANGNDHDVRVVVIGNRSFAIKRMVRKNDFRASGSGEILYNKELFDESLIRLAFDIHKKIDGQCTAMDFIFEEGQAKLVEISYGFVPEGYDTCPGFWDDEMTWFDGPFNPYGWMVEETLK